MKEILNHLFQHQTLTREVSRGLLINLAKGKYNASQIAAFLTIFQLRNITVDELQGFRDALIQLCIPLKIDDYETIDLCGTGGDGKDTFNISTLASFVVAGTGAKVTKHGNYGVSSTCGSSNILEYFGYKFTNNPDTLRKQLDRTGICFLHAPQFHPAMKSVAPIRKELAIKTFFNMLGPMVNPASPDYQLIGVFNLELARIYNYIYQESDKSYAIVHNLDGYDEISLTGEFKLQTNSFEVIAGPDYFGVPGCDPADLKGGRTIKESADIFLNILEGRGTLQQNNAVLVNAGVALKTMDSKKSYQECIFEAKEALLEGKALACFKKLVSNN